MLSLSHLFRRYTGVLRQIKALYVINNWLQRGKLRHNRELYRRYGLRRSIYAPIGSHNFGKHSPDIPWLDRPDALERLRESEYYQLASPALQTSLENFVTDGYLILPGFFAPAEVGQLNREIDQLLREGAVDFNYTKRKIMESHQVSPQARAFFHDRRLLELLGFLLGRDVIPFQSINFIEGSEQRAHSDFIHMSTEPQGYLIAAWIALEDIGPDQGPLVYYPGSHRLPYLTAKDYDSGNSSLLIGAHSNRAFEDKVASLIEEHQFTPQYLLAGAGDVLIWHANLLHGGSPILRPGATRRSMVAHYFAEGAICYHEISQRPALMP